MKKIDILITLGVIVLLFSGCIRENKTSSEINNTVVIKINPTEINSLDDFIDKVESIRFLPLETNNENTIDYVQKLWLTDRSMFIMTRSTNEVHKYRHDGTFQFKIEKKGKGKEELSSVFDFCPAPNDGLFILGYRNYYEFDSHGKMLRITPIIEPFESYGIRKFYIVNDTFSVFASSSTGCSERAVENNYIWVVNKLSNENRFCMYRYTKGIVDEVFHQSNDIILVNPYFGLDTIYSWQDNMVKPLYCIDFGDYKTSVDKIPADYYDGWKAVEFLNTTSGCLYINSAFMSDDWLMFKFMFKADDYQVLYHKKTANMLVGNYADNLHPHILYCTVPVAVFQNEFIYSIPAYLIVKKLESNSLDFKFLSEARHNEIIDQLKKVKETDNPVLMFVKMKPE
ncbi:MAG: 6-bladed beta-propeller [Bacteroidales bacterium]|nr:6-bladed beta-propeller [Bacteroidales bacterium]